MPAAAVAKANVVGLARRRRCAALFAWLALAGVAGGWADGCADAWTGGWIGAAHAAPLPASGSVEVLFTPWDDAEGAIVRALFEARRTVHVQAYLLTSRSIAYALQEAKARGVVVEILADRDMLHRGKNSLLPMLAAGGIRLWLETRYAAAHNKLILIDAGEAHPVVMTGSYNFTWSAQARNAENLLILRDNPALARRYLDNWRRHRDDAQPYGTASGAAPAR